MTGRGRVLLTGASGFVGRALARDLAAAGWRVRALLRRAAPLPGVDDAVEGDLAERIDWASALAGVDAVVHAAGIAHAGPGLPDALYERVNRDATLALGEAAAGRVARFVFVSSIRAQSGPTAEGVLDETTAAAPTDAYGRSKLAAEEGLSRLDLACASLRPVVVYGPGVRGNVGALLKLAGLPVPLPFGCLSAPRSFVSLENLSDAVRLLLDRPEPARGPLVVADPVPTSVSGLVSAMRRARDARPLLLPVPTAVMGALAGLAGQRETWQRLAGPMAASPARLVSLGWRPPVPTTPAGVERWLRPGPG